MNILKNNHRLILFILAAWLSASTCTAQTSGNAFSQPPAWASRAIWYQIFVERFRNGDPANDPTPSSVNIPPLGRIAPAGWQVTPWTRDWFSQEPWAVASGTAIRDEFQFRRYGGDLQGVLDKLDYLQDLGVNALFMNPLNDAPSMHKYDARNYHHIDVNFGPDPKGDSAIIASEKPDDPATWKWTSADRMFLKLVKEAHKRRMKVIMDYSWNHTGAMFWAWQDILKNQTKSPYRDWYAVTAFDDPATAQNEFSYKGWAGVMDLPELRKTDIRGERVNGHPYEGNLNEGAKKHIFDVTKRWLTPDGDAAAGIDGFRLDVADQIGLGFWRDYRTFVRSVKPDAYLVGEIWWAEWPDHLMDPRPYLAGDVFDAVMFYQAYRPARYFFAKTDFSTDAGSFVDSIRAVWQGIAPATLDGMMNVATSHDTPRLLSDFYNPNKYKYHATPNDDPAYRTGKPDAETYRRLQLYLAWSFTTRGAPHIWNGEELGMWGADDPHCRKPLWWPDYKFDPETRTNYLPGEKSYDPVGYDAKQHDWYKKLAKIRTDNPVLSAGEMKFLTAEGKRLSYSRSDKKSEIIVLFNLDATAQDFELPQPGPRSDLLTGRKITGKKITVEPLGVMILKRNNK